MLKVVERRDGTEHFDYVRNTEVVGQALEDLMRFSLEFRLAVTFITELCQSVSQ